MMSQSHPLRDHLHDSRRRSSKLPPLDRDRDVHHHHHHHESYASSSNNRTSTTTAKLTTNSCHRSFASKLGLIFSSNQNHFDQTQSLITKTTIPACTCFNVSSKRWGTGLKLGCAELWTFMATPGELSLNSPSTGNIIVSLLFNI